MTRSRPNDWLRVGDNVPISVMNAVRQGSVRALQPVHVSGWSSLVKADVGVTVTRAAMTPSVG